MLTKEQIRYQKVFRSHRTIDLCNAIPTDCVNASSVNMFRNKIDKYLKKAGLRIDEYGVIIQLSMSQWLPCRLISRLLFALDGNLCMAVK